jgi:hypothetical protein
MANGWGGKREGAGRPRGSRCKRTIPLIPARAHRETIEKMPLDILMAAARNEGLPLEIRLAAAKAAAPYYHVRISSGPAKAAFEMTQFELQSAIDRQREHMQRDQPGQRYFRVVGNGS